MRDLSVDIHRGLVSSGVILGTLQELYNEALRLSRWQVLQSGERHVSLRSLLVQETCLHSTA